MSVVTGTGGQSRAGQEGTGFRGAASWALGRVGVYDECLLPPPSVRTAVGSGEWGCPAVRCEEARRTGAAAGGQRR